MEIGLSSVNVHKLIGEVNTCIRCEYGGEISMTLD
jgi:hypothetical protein